MLKPNMKGIGLKTLITRGWNSEACEEEDQIGNVEKTVMEHGTMRTRGWNLEFHEEEDGTQNPENKGMEVGILRTKSWNMES